MGDSIWKLNQHWKFINYKTSQFDEIERNWNINLSRDKFIKKQKGIWLPCDKKENNYAKLSGIEKDKINNQIDYFISLKYQFINYNGLQNRHLDEMESETENPFNNKVIIIDEVHNLISRVVGGGTGLRLYNLLMKAENIKLVLLSGTPLINYPYESAFLLNLLRGNLYEFTIKLNIDKKNKSFEELISWFTQNKLIDQIFVDEKNRTINFTRNPKKFSDNLGSFENKELSEFKISSESKEEYITNENFMKTVEKMLKSFGYSIKSTKINQYLALPTEEKKFDQMFIDNKTSEVINQE